MNKGADLCRDGEKKQRWRKKTEVEIKIRGGNKI